MSSALCTNLQCKRTCVSGNQVHNVVQSFCSQESLIPAGVSIVELIRLYAWNSFDQGQEPITSRPVSRVSRGFGFLNVNEMLCLKKQNKKR